MPGWINNLSHLASFAYTTQMDSSKDISDVNNATIMSGIWLAFSWEQRDIQADDLPMMNSILWPIGEFLKRSLMISLKMHMKRGPIYRHKLYYDFGNNHEDSRYLTTIFQSATHVTELAACTRLEDHFISYISSFLQIRIIHWTELI